MNRLPLLSLVAVILAVTTLEGRIISYAPVSSEFSRPAIQPRDNTAFLLLESRVPLNGDGIMMFPGPPPATPRGVLVIHDADGTAAPRVVFERSKSGDFVEHAAMNETADGARHLLVVANPESGVWSTPRYFYSGDGGTTWSILAIPEGFRTSAFYREDVGGPVARGRGAQIRLGNSDTPFVLAARQAGPNNKTFIYAVDRTGEVRRLVEIESGSNGMLIGSDLDRSRFLITGRPVVDGEAKPNGVRMIRLDATLDDVLLTDAVHPRMEGWITSDGSVYLEEDTSQMQRLRLISGGREVPLIVLEPRASRALLLSVPAHDFEGVWIVIRKTGEPTSLLRHRLNRPFEEMWSDVTGPEVEAIHPAASGERLLIQVHRERVAPQALIIDPALAVWEIGSAAPRRYDELFLDEGPAKGFVSLDVDSVAEGGSFVFDSAAREFLPPPEFSSGGGGEVSQEWGVVRASLQQKLVLPAVARIPGAFGSYWKSDVIFQNGDSEPIRVTLSFAPTGSSERFDQELVLAPRELRLVQDALFELYGFETGGGALFITPEPGRHVVVTSRLYTEGERGTFGMGVSAIDVHVAASPRFFMTFAGAFQGAGTRTNLLVTDTAGNGGVFAVKASGPTGPTGRPDMQWGVPAGGQVQINDLASSLSIGQRAAARFEALTGRLIASLVSIDNATNDPTLFPPDVAAGATRMIPIIGHTDGANGAKYRTDLFLHNPSDVVKTIWFRTKPLDSDERETALNFTLLPFESKVIPDVYKTAFAKEGTGRLRFESGTAGESAGIRVTARIYTEATEGGTYGFVMPALNAFQSAGPGESLEIVGATIDPRFRTNLALVDTAANSNGTVRRVRVEILGSGGEVIDQFETQIRTAGGMQLADLFGNRGLTSETPVPVVIRVSPLEGLVGAFATLIDNGTNDPMYLGAGLASRQ